MKRIIILVLVLLTIFFYLGIEISYNNPVPLHKVLIPYLSSFEWLKVNPFDKVYSSGIKLGKLYSQVLISFLFLIICSFIKQKIWLLLASIFVIFIWLKNYIIYGGIMDTKIYLHSSVYFLVCILILNIFNFIYKEKSFSNS